MRKIRTLYGNDASYLCLDGPISNELMANMWMDIYTTYQKNPSQIFVLMITSPGGSFHAAYNFYQRVRFYEINLVTVAIGTVFSAAAIMYLAGNERIAYDGALFLFHDGRTEHKDAMLTEDDHEKHARNLRKTRLAQEQLLMKRLKLGRRKISKIIHDGEDLLVDEALALGIVNKIMQ